MRLVNLFALVLTMIFTSCLSNKNKKLVDNELMIDPLPTYLGDKNNWQLENDLSDSFNYKYSPSDKKTTFGSNKWTNFFQNAWDGPGTTYWKYNHVFVDGRDLVIKTSRWHQENEEKPLTRKPNKMGMPEVGINTGCITSTKKVLYPVFVEAKVSVTDLVLASDVWLLSQDSTQEIDIIECYGGREPGNNFFSKFIHLSHHSFIRKPFTDYQPTDKGSWYQREGVKGWGEFSKGVNGQRKYVTTGVYWKNPFHFEYYIDGELVRVLFDKSVATKINGVWEYGYPIMEDGKLVKVNGRQQIAPFSSTDMFSLEELKKANKVSKVSVIDPYKYQGGKGFTKELNIIINVEAQNWHAKAGRIPTDADLNDDKKNNSMKVAWLRVFKPKQ